MNQGLPPYKYKRIIRELREIIKTKDQIIRNISKDKETVKDIETRLRREYDNRRSLDKHMVESMQHSNSSLRMENIGHEKEIEGMKEAYAILESSVNDRIDRREQMIVESTKRISELESRTLFERIFNRV